MTHHPEDPSTKPDRHGWILVLLLTIGLSLSTALSASAQDDPTTPQTGLPDGHSPSSALWRAAVVPGWGQYYNRQYIKIPLVYAGLAGFAAAAISTNDSYTLYGNAYLFTARVNEDGSPVFPEFAGDYAQLIDDLGLTPEVDLTDEEIASRRARLEPQFRAQRDNLRRNRDLLYFGFVFWYGLSMIDAFVSAHLMDFDVGEDLTVTLYPEPRTAGLTATLRWGF